ncbi:MAG TPA: hypothetical protein VGX48_07870 [Pyrinomonadaceae bacterium]|jgi:hypothetical protein|nr:hypothetical protein [Pyrinomonadaceae bacterium]
MSYFSPWSLFFKPDASMKAREFRFPEKAFPEAYEQEPCRLRARREVVLKTAETAPPRAPGVAAWEVAFAMKVYAPNVAQGWEQYSPQNTGNPLDTPRVLM